MFLRIHITYELEFSIDHVSQTHVACSSLSSVEEFWSIFFQISIDAID